MKVIPVSQKLRLQRVFILLFDLYDVKEKTYPYYGYHSSGCDHRSSTHAPANLFMKGSQSEESFLKEDLYSLFQTPEESLPLTRAPTPLGFVLFPL